MIEVSQLKQLAKNGAVIAKLQSGELISTEVDLSHLPDEERIEYLYWVRMLNDWAAPHFSKLDSDLVYSDKQGGYYRCNFRKAKSVVEFEERINDEFENYVKSINKVNWYIYPVKLLRDNFVLSILILVLTWLGLEYLVGVNQFISKVLGLNG
ncbi:hypothetical protein GL178_09185 [Vibrio toranzoniae]|uniref:hypothetical protein n=1 Tax=Vibrio toranzoniae TaxID=1194427 RepID=UPI0013777949|nr:hypothetical protein [Vibrio toranzoniae]NAZ46413.1 hypothetical protein [Vibrio toranzoniae]